MDVRRRESSHFSSELAGRGSAVINHVYRLRDSTTGLHTVRYTYCYHAYNCVQTVSS